MKKESRYTPGIICHPSGTINAQGIKYSTAGSIMLTGEQIRAARALARLEQTELAKASGISVPTIKRLEMLRGPISANTATEAAIRKAFLEAGVIFIDENGDGPGVRLKRR